MVAPTPRNSRGPRPTDNAWAALSTASPRDPPSTERTESLVGPDSLKAFLTSPRDYAIAAANAFMGGDDATRESVKTIDVAMRDGDRMFNCANSAIATDAVLAGNPASALPGEVTRAPDLAKYYGTNWSPMMSSALEVEEAMKQLPEGSRAIVIGAPTNASIGHFYNAASRGGVVRFFDGQSGRVPSTAAYTRFFILRTN